MNSHPHQPVASRVPSTGETIPFRNLKPGQTAVIVSLSGNSHDVARLSEMGFRRGVAFTATRTGKTAIITIDFQTICLRLSDEIDVQVQLLSSR